MEENYYEKYSETPWEDSELDDSIYICPSCGLVFKEPKVYYEDRTPYGGFGERGFTEQYKGCPNCSSGYDEAGMCEYCNVFFPKSELEEINGKLLCEKCIEKLIELGEISED